MMEKKVLENGACVIAENEAGFKEQFEEAGLTFNFYVMTFVQSKER